MTAYTVGRARLHMPRPVLTAAMFRTELPVDGGTGTGGGVTAELPDPIDYPPGYPPVVGVWSEGFDVEMTPGELDAFLKRLDEFRDGLRALRLLMGPVWPTDPAPAVQARRDAPEGPS